MDQDTTYLVVVPSMSRYIKKILGIIMFPSKMKNVDYAPNSTLRRFGDAHFIVLTTSVGIYKYSGPIPVNHTVSPLSLLKN